MNGINMLMKPKLGNSSKVKKAGQAKVLLEPWVACMCLGLAGEWYQEESNGGTTSLVYEKTPVDLRTDDSRALSPFRHSAWPAHMYQ